MKKDNDRTWSEFLQSELRKIRAMISTYYSLSRRKQRKRKYWEHYTSLRSLEFIFNEALGKETKARYVGEEPKIEVCELEGIHGRKKDKL